MDKTKELERARAHIGNASIIAVDTEYDSFRYFREKLCLIQIRAGSVTYLVDPLADIDMAMLREPFGDPRILKVMHAGDNDIRLLGRDYGFTVHPVFDTHRAASLLGNSHLALSSIVADYLGAELIKTKRLQRSRWDQRPLSDEQIHYAVRDTLFLIDLYRVLETRLCEEGLDEKARETFAAMTKLRWNEKTFDPDGYYRIPGVEELDGDQCERLRKLYHWRFETAERTNRSRFMIFSDQELLALALLPAGSPDDRDLRHILTPRKIAEYGDDLAGILGAAVVEGRG